MIIASGSEAVVPSIEGLDGTAVWTNRQVFTTDELPDRATIVGGSAVGIETAMFLIRFGVEVTIVQRSDRLLRREEARVGELAGEHVRAAGVDVRTGVRPARAWAAGTDSVLDLQDGTSVRGDMIVFATAVRPALPASGSNTPASPLTTAGRWWSTSTVRPPRASGRSVTSPRSCPSPT